MTDENKCRDQKTKTKWTGLWCWFLTGFLIVFLWMGFSFMATAIGGAPGTVMRVNLFQFYYYETGAWLRSTGGLGPMMPSLSDILITLGFHLVCAAVAGIVFLGIGWVIRKFSSRSMSQA